MNEHVDQTKSGRFSAFLNLNAVNVLLTPKKKIHDFTFKGSGIDYSFECFNHDKQGYLTGQNRNVKQGDYILLKVNGAPRKYEVKEIDYYSSPDDMWMARLVKVEYL